MNSIKGKKCVLFDLDGTLVNTRDLIVNCFHEIFKREGVALPSYNDIAVKIGLPFRLQLESFTGKLTDEKYFALRDAHKEYQHSIYKDYLKPCPGAIETVTQLYQLGYSLGVVTSRSKDSASDYLRHFHLFSYFSTLVTPDDCALHKPDPAPVLLALQRLNICPSEAVFVGDSIYDIEAASRAGVVSVYASYGLADFSTIEARPDFVVSDLTEILSLIQ